MDYETTYAIQKHKMSVPTWSRMRLLSVTITLIFKAEDSSFFSAVVMSCYPTTNNQLRNLSNPRKQATINDGRVTLQPIHGRQISFATSTTRTYTPGASKSNSGKQKTVICYNCKGEGHISKKCTKPKKKWDDAWFKDKVLLSQHYSTNQSSTPLSITYPSDDYQSSVYHNVYSLQSSISQLKYAPTINQQPQECEFPQLDSGLTVLVFKQDNPINAINHMMSFLSAVVTSRYPTTNNQLRNLSNPRKQATINDGRVTLQPIHGRQISFATTTTRTYTPGASKSNSGKQKTVICYNCKGEGHISKKCTKPKKKWDDAWFKDKVLLCTQPKRPRNTAWFKEKLMLAEAQEAGQILDEEQLAFLADPSILEALVSQQTIPQNSTFHTEDLDAYDSDCNDLSLAKAVLMANLSSCDPEVLFEVPYTNSYLNKTY
nr:hypothetical protein [Tanacetum cinerariifolium]